MSTITLGVSGMMCGNCQKHVHDILADLEGVQQVAVSLEKEEATIEYEGQQINEEVFKEAFSDTNYQLR